MARILHVLPAFLPATDWGGPVVSTAALCRAGVAAGHQVTVLTTDAASPETSARLPLHSKKYVFPEGYKAIYTRRMSLQSIAPGLLWRLPRLVAQADLVHLSMTYSFPTLPTLLVCKLFQRPVVWSPRGAIQATEEWRDAPRKRVKSAFEAVARRLLPLRTILHVTAPEEARSTARRMPGVPVEVIPNAVSVPPTPPARAFRPNGALRLLFLSRLHPKKGLEALLDALAMLPNHVTLTIAGRGAAHYEQALKASVRDLGLAPRVRFLGRVDGAAKARALAEADLFVLPTRSENFGIVIAEALAAGVPVITTEAAPWPELEPRGCGLRVGEEAADLAAAIREMDTRAPDTFAEMGRAGHRWMAEAFAEEAVGQRVARLYARLLAAPSADGLGSALEVPR